KKIKAVLKFADYALNNLNIFRTLLLKRKFSLHQLDIEYEEHINNEIARFISTHQDKEYFKRSGKELNWMLDYRWVLENDEQAWHEAVKYYFSSAELVFKYHCLSFRENGKLLAFAILRQRNKSFTLPYIYSEKKSGTRVLQAIFEFLLQHKATDFTLFHPEFTECADKQEIPFFYTRKIPKDFAVSNEISHLISSGKFLQDGDGDCAFT
ncbi:MAG: hypothetical protein U9R19_13440, partial [Bacteroidota bacterium]|nr:hypothetical protein [Bacteroidota bacterium]